MKKGITTALIGCGRIAFLLEKDPLRKKPCTHFGGAQKSGIRINFAADTDMARLKDFAAAAKIPPEACYSDYKKMLTEKKPSLVIICAWTQLHAQMIIDAAEAKAKVIVAEKPIASSLSDAKKAIEACRKNKTTLIINHERRYDPAYIKAKEMIDKGIIGKIISVKGSIFTSGFHGQNISKTGGGPLLHDGTHLIDMVHFLAGKSTGVRGFFSRTQRTKGFEDYACAMMNLEGNIPAFVETGGGAKFFTFELDITGTAGRIQIGNGFRRLYLPCKSRFYKGFHDLTEKQFPHVSQGNCFSNLYKEVMDILSKPEFIPASTGEDAYHTLEVINAIYSSQHKKRDIKLPLKGKTVSLKKIFSLSD